MHCFNIENLGGKGGGGGGLKEGGGGGGLIYGVELRRGNMLRREKCQCTVCNALILEDMYNIPS